ncbi:MAG: hypothetical protein KME45_33445 [Stenomitos rutilans HA7619-LM2]|nr:hypothetical protein [Stenomitos rutilans HA7619-LM2]
MSEQGEGSILNETSSLSTVESHVGTASSPLAAIISSSGRDTLVSGDRFNLSVTISNKGHQSAIITVLIDALSPSLQQWCESDQEQLALGPNQSDEVIFPIQIPIEALPGIYRYFVVVDAQEHYPEDTPIRYEQQLQVLPATQNTIRSNDPTFVLVPPSSSANPAILQAGAALQFQVLVYNRGDRVDRFRLACTDLPKTWFNIIYPPSAQGGGLIAEADSLNLNPGEQGVILLLFNPPFDALAGSYVPTLRLYSETLPELVLLDLVYLQVPPVYLLQAELRTIIGQVKRQAGLFQVRLSNSGNTPRSITLSVQNLNEEALCFYTLEPATAQVAPQSVVGVDLRVQPDPWWRRPIYGGGRVINFNVSLQDDRQLPLPIDQLPGLLVWEPRPWWQFFPLLVLSILGVLGLVYLLWWLLFRTPPSPQIAQFAPADSGYAAINDDVVRLNWQINNADRLQSITINGLSSDGTLLTRPEVYDFSRGMPAALESFCTQSSAVLTCNSVRTTARKAGTYLFEMTTASKRAKGAISDTRKSIPVKIEAVPLPQIVGFASTQPIYQEPSGFVIKPIAQPIAKTAKPTRKMIINPVDPNSKESKAFGVRLNWAIANPDQLRAVQVVGRTPDGGVASPLKQYDFSQGIPKELQAVCSLQQVLICQAVPTELRKPGDYVFELTALPKVSSGEKSPSQKTELIKLLPRSPQIVAFQLNGKPIQPKYFIPMTTGQAVGGLVLSWLIDTSSGSRAELLPVPGSVPLKGALPIFLSPKPGSVTLTLQVTSPAGQQVTQAVTLETYDPAAGDPATTAAAAAAAAIANAQASPSPSAATPTAPGDSPPGTLAPIAIPPQFDRR